LEITIQLRLRRSGVSYWIDEKPELECDKHRTTLPVLFFWVNQIMKSDAEICREKGWQVGDVLEGDEGDGPTRILITAIGERHILAKELSHNAADRQRQESHWTVQARERKKV